MKLKLDFKGGGNILPFRMNSLFYIACFLGDDSDEVGFKIRRDFYSYCHEIGDDYTNAEPVELDFSGATKDYLFRISNSVICACDVQISELNEDIERLKSCSGDSIILFLNRNLEIVRKIKSQFIELRDYATKLS